MNETEIERLVVRLMGDGSGAQKMWQDAVKQADEAAKRVEAAGKHIEGIGAKLEGFAHQAVTALTGLAEFEFLKGAFEAFSGREQMIIKLNAAIKGNGHAVEETVAQYKTFAKEMAEVSLTSAGGVLDLLRQAETFELSGGAAQRAVKDAMALAAATDGEAGSLLRLTAALANGDMEMAMHSTRMIKQLKGIHDPAELAARVSKLVAIGLETMGEQSKSAEGHVHHFNTAIQGLKGDLGKAVSEGFKPAIETGTGFVNYLRSLPAWMKEATVAIIALTAAVTALITVVGVFQALALAAKIKAAFTALGTFAIAANPYLIAAVGVLYLTFALLELAEYLKKADVNGKALNDTLERTAKFKEQTESVLATAGGKTGKEHKSYLEDQLKVAQDELMNTLKNSGQQALDSGEFDPNKMVAAVGDSLAAATERVKKLKEELDKVKDPTTNKKLVGDIRDFVKELETEYQTFGLVGNQAKIAKFEIDGATEAMLEKARAIAAAREMQDASKKADDEAAEKAKKLTESVDEYIKTLKSEVAMFGMSADAAKIYKFALDGVNEADLESMRTLSAKKESMEYHKKAMEDVKRITEENMTPLEKYYKETDDLFDLLEEDAGLSMDTFNRAMAAAKKRLDEATEGTKQARQEIEKFDAALSGSAEAATRIANYRDMIGRSGKDGAMAGGAEVKRFDAVQAGGAEANTRTDNNRDLLVRIAQTLEDQAKKPGVILQPAELA